VITYFERCTAFELAKVSTRLTNHCGSFGNDDCFGCLTVGPRVSLSKHASNDTEAAVSDMIETALPRPQTTEKHGWLKVNLNPRLRLPRFGNLFLDLQADGSELDVHWWLLICEVKAPGLGCHCGAVGKANYVRSRGWSDVNDLKVEGTDERGL
jgi:hypothetical protein